MLTLHAKFSDRRHTTFNICMYYLSSEFHCNITLQVQKISRSGTSASILKLKRSQEEELRSQVENRETYIYSALLQVCLTQLHIIGVCHMYSKCVYRFLLIYMPFFIYIYKNVSKSHINTTFPLKFSECNFAVQVSLIIFEMLAIQYL